MAGDTQLLTCTECGRTWARATLPGRLPSRCPECYAAADIPEYRRRRAGQTGRRSSDRIDEGSPGYMLAAKQTEYISAMVTAYWAIRNKRYGEAETVLKEVIPQGRL